MKDRMATPLVTPDHDRRRASLRRVGPPLLIVGVLLLIGGFYLAFIEGFTSSRPSLPPPAPTVSSGDPLKDFEAERAARAARFEAERDRMHADFSHGASSLASGMGLCFLGMLCLGAGAFFTKLGYLGAATRYVAAETVPVARDAIDHLTEGGRPLIRGPVVMVSSGGQTCTACNSQNPAGARFCNGCGAAL